MAQAKIAAKFAMDSLKDLFLLDPEVVFLNHGSFGACPKAVFEAYQDWQRQLERQPVEFLARRAIPLLGEARSRLADFLGCRACDLVYFPNPTTALNMVARNLERVVKGYSGKPLQQGDEILTTNHEYGAMDRTWRYVCASLGVKYVNRPVLLPLVDEQKFVEDFWQGVNPRTKAIYLSHITSPTALTFPIEAVCRRARQEGLLTIIDGAHAPGQIDLDLPDLGADIYAGACHKWLMAPKGSAFLYVRKEMQPYLDPLVVSWGYQPEPGFGSGIPFIDHHEWQGTRDVAAFLSVPAAIEFQEQHGWEHVRQICHTLAVEARRRINSLTGSEPICSEAAFQQMFAVRLPPETDLADFSSRLYRDFRIEAPAISWNGQKLLRVSVQGYNDRKDLDRLTEAILSLLFESRL
jgi:isopenicillin-N epimerase